jgi:hypothetical protein
MRACLIEGWVGGKGMALERWFSGLFMCLRLFRGRWISIQLGDLVLGKEGSLDRRNTECSCSMLVWNWSKFAGLERTSDGWCMALIYGPRFTRNRVICNEYDVCTYLCRYMYSMYVIRSEEDLRCLLD